MGEVRGKVEREREGRKGERLALLAVKEMDVNDNVRCLRYNTRRASWLASSSSSQQGWSDLLA